MSKKRPKSDRETDLPDWADDVTPADEVMRKFYAPTGAFKSGPIAVAAPVTDAAPAAPPKAGADEETRPENRYGEEANHTRLGATRAAAVERQQSEPASNPQVSQHKDVTKVEESPAASPPPPPVSEEIELTRIQDVIGDEGSASGSAPRPAKESADQAQSASFEEFARKWRRYLYPGQLAVMRTLYELTLARGSAECFTQYSQIAAATKMTRRNCINVMNSLVERGFVERLEVRNDAAGKGIRLRVHPDPLP
jgi:DNA-binding MarR family transcriptional regulator